MARSDRRVRATEIRVCALCAPRSGLHSHNARSNTSIETYGKHPMFTAVWRCGGTKQHQENLIQTHPIIINKLPRFRPEMGARGTPEPQKLSYISQVQPQTEFSTIFDQFLPPFWEALGTLGATFARPWPPLDAFFVDFLQCLF